MPADLDLLLSLREDRVLETPPSSPPPPSSGFAGCDFDNGSPRRIPHRSADMSVFLDAVKDCLDVKEPTATSDCVKPKPKKPKKSGEVEIVVEKYSGLRIRNSVISSIELANHFSDIRFVRLPAIRNLLVGDTVSGCWATVGVLIEKGPVRLSSAGKNYCIWKLGCLDEWNVSVFLFGDAYSRNSTEPVGTVFALLNSVVRKDTGGTGYSLSVYSAGQIVKVGTSADYGICKGKRKDGMPCTMAINRQKGAYCKYHLSSSSKTYSTKRPELNGGNMFRTYRLQTEGIYMVKPPQDRFASKKSVQPVKVMSVDGLRKALSNADKVTSNRHSQGIRFLSQVTANMETKFPSKHSSAMKKAKRSSDKRAPTAMNIASKATDKLQPDVKRQKLEQGSQKMVELDVVSSDDDYC